MAADFFHPVGVKLSSAGEVRAEAQKRATDIFRNYQALSGILQRHEATIRKRWSKRTRQQRIAVLLNAWPNMAARHRPDFDAFRKQGGRMDAGGGRAYIDCFMWPYINQEDLSQARPLMLLLNARGRHHPSSFAGADMEAMHLGVVTNAIERVYLNGHTMVLNGVTTADGYGKLVSWDDHPDAFDWMHHQKQFGPADGLVVLEAQEKLMQFLVDCCRELLHDMPADQLAGDAHPVRPEPPLRAERETSGFDSLAIMAAEAPYRVPAQLHLGRIVSLLAATARAAEDHLWALREDPAYFHAELFGRRDHRQEMIVDSRGQVHPTLKPGRERLFWARTIGDVLASAHVEPEIYSELHRQAQALVALQHKYAAAILPMEDLPKEYLEALLTFRHFLTQAARGPKSQLKSCFVASPPMRRLYVREPPPDASSSRIVVRSKVGVKKSKTEQQVEFLLRTLWEDNRELFLYSMSIVVDELGRLLQSDPAASELVSSYIAAIIGNLSITSQCLHQLELYHPWAGHFEMAVVKIQPDLERAFGDKATSWAQAIDALDEKHLTKAAEMGEPVAGRFAYPSEKRRTKENVEVLRRAESNLDAFWAEIDRLMHTKVGSLEGTTVRGLFSRPRLLQRTPEWVEPPPPPPPPPASETAASRVPTELAVSPPDFGLLGNQHQQPPRAPAETPKTKTKTRGRRGQQGATGPPATEADAPPDKGDKRAVFRVDSRALKVFRTLFFNPDLSSTPGEVPWNDFLHAMSAVGFAAEKLYGSVWQFAPTRLDVEASIQFHEPHPKAKLPFTTARRYGRRLTRNYGWEGDMFVSNK